MVNAILLDIKVDQECMPINNMGKFSDIPMKKSIQVRADKGKLFKLTKSKAITQMRLMIFGWYR